MDAATNDRFKRITTFIFDVDGVMTDGGVIALESGEQPRVFNVKDGYGINRAIKMGYRVAILSAQNQVGVRKRLEYLGVTEILMGTTADGKLPVFREYIAERNLTEDEILFMGDDLPDWEVMNTNVLGACPADSSGEILVAADYISPKNGGYGAVRDVIEQVMKAQGKWMTWFDAKNTELVK